MSSHCSAGTASGSSPFNDAIVRSYTWKSRRALRLRGFCLMPYELHILRRTLFLPPASPLLIGMAGLVLWRRRPRLGKALFAVCIVTLLALCTPLLADALAHAAEDYPALDPAHLTANQARAQAIVILGGGTRRNAPEAGGDAPGGGTELRLIEGARGARATHLPILVSGGADED